MTARIFAYIVHKGGVVDDSAAELLAAAKNIDPAASPTAIVTGSGAGTRCRLQQLSALRTPRCGRSPATVSPTRMLSWFARLW